MSAYAAIENKAVKMATLKSIIIPFRFRRKAGDTASASKTDRETNLVFVVNIVIFSDIGGIAFIAFIGFIGFSSRLLNEA